MTDFKVQSLTTEEEAISVELSKFLDAADMYRVKSESPRWAFCSD